MQNNEIKDRDVDHYQAKNTSLLSGAEIALLLIITIDLLNIDMPFELSIIQGINALYFVLPLIFLFLIVIKLATGWVYFNQSAIMILYFLFISYALVNSFYLSIRPDISSRYAILIASWFFAFIFFSQFRTIRIERVLYAYVCILAIYFFISILFNLVQMKPRLSSVTLGGDESRMGLLAFTGLTMTFYLSRLQLFRYQALRLMVITILAVGLIYAGSRAVYLILFLAGISSIFGNRIFKATDMLALASLSVVTLIGLFVLGTVLGIDAITNQMDKLFGFITESAKIGSDRFVYFEFARRIVLDNPMLFIAGIGLESYLEYESDLEDVVGRVNVLHNMYLQYFIGLGVVGLSIFGAYLLALKRAIRKLSNQLARDFLSMLFLGFVIYGFFHPSTVSRGLLFYLPLFVALLIRKDNNSSNLASP